MAKSVRLLIIYCILLIVFIFCYECRFFGILKGYSGAKTKGYDAAMRKATRGHPLSYKDEMRNKRVSSKRSPVERFFAFTKRVCKVGHVTVTTVARVKVKMIVTGIVFNVYHLASAKSKLET